MLSSSALAASETAISSATSNWPASPGVPIRHLIIDGDKHMRGLDQGAAGSSDFDTQLFQGIVSDNGRDNAFARQLNLDHAVDAPRNYFNNLAAHLIARADARLGVWRQQ